MLASMYEKPNIDDAILRELVGQVSKAVPAGQSERAVTTVISRPMWEAWCRATGIPKGAKPSEWRGIDSYRVYGSKTVVIESSEMVAVSFAGRYEG